MKKPNLLITGHRGLLGSACVKVLGEQYNIITFNDIDLRNREEVYWAFNGQSIDFCIHCAAKVGGVKANRDDCVSFLEDNVAINSNVISACNLFKVRKLVNIGTSCLYPKDAPVPVKEESFMTGPFEQDVEAYSAAKLLAHYQCRAYRHQHGCNFVTACPANLFGPNDNYGESAHVIPSLIRKAFEAKEIGTNLKVWGDGSAVREFLHSNDAAEAIKLILEHFDEPGLINIGSGIGTSIRAIAESIAGIVGVKGVEYDISEPTGIQKKTFDISKLTNLGWKPKVTLKAGLIEACSDYENNINIRNK